MESGVVITQVSGEGSPTFHHPVEDNELPHLSMNGEFVQAIHGRDFINFSIRLDYI